MAIAFWSTRKLQAQIHSQQRSRRRSFAVSIDNGMVVNLAVSAAFCMWTPKKHLEHSPQPAGAKETAHRSGSYHGGYFHEEDGKAEKDPASSFEMHFRELPQASNTFYL
mmetsp:Transcript_59869/g.104711  ORF Transcript_59869/g.104711 Transcript_59869/m.104711 type:complete len:109 (+) Transcript_59869:1996-2322(+)